MILTLEDGRVESEEKLVQFSYHYCKAFAHSICIRTVKFVFFEKATKFDEIFILLLTNTSFSVFPARLLNF